MFQQNGAVTTWPRVREATSTDEPQTSRDQFIHVNCSVPAPNIGFAEIPEGDDSHRCLVSQSWFVVQLNQDLSYNSFS